MEALFLSCSLLELLAKEEQEVVTFGFVTPDVCWSLLAFRVQNLMSCSWVAQPVIQEQAGQCCAAQLGSGVVGVEPHKGAHLGLKA